VEVVITNPNNWSGRIPVQGGNNGIIVVTVNGVEHRLTVNAQQAGSRNHNVPGYVIRVTTNDNNFVTAVVVTAVHANGTIDTTRNVVINSVVSLTPGTGNSQN